MYAMFDRLMYVNKCLYMTCCMYMPLCLYYCLYNSMYICLTFSMYHSLSCAYLTATPQVESVCPSVFGHLEVKRGILLMLFGGVHKVGACMGMCGACICGHV